MSSRPTLIRKAALAVVRHAGAVLPAARADWASAMQNETQCIDDDRTAFLWALGSVAASYAERIRSVNLLKTRQAGLILAVLALWRAIVMFFAPAMILAYRSKDLGAATALGARTPGDDFHRFVPLMNATPTWLAGLWVLSGLLYLAAAATLVRNRQGAFALFSLGLTLEGLGLMSNHLVPGLAELNRQAFGFASRNFNRDVLIPAAQVVLLIGLGASLWWRERAPLRVS